MGEGCGDAVDEQIGDERGVEGAGADGDEVGALDGVEGFGQRGGVGRVERELDDAAVAGGDVGFAADEGAVVHARGEGGVGGGGGVDAAAGGENLGGELDGLGEVAGDLSEGGDEEVAEAVALEGVAGAEAMVEERARRCFFFAEGDHAVAQVAGGEHVEVFAEAAGGAAVVGDGDDGGEVGDAAAGLVRGLAGTLTWRRRPRRRVERPVPPPMATTRRGWTGAGCDRRRRGGSAGVEACAFSE